MDELVAIVLAAGHGKRMKSSTPKVMHKVAGRPLVHYCIAAAIEAGAVQAVVVVGHEREQVVPYLHAAFGSRVRTAVQEQQHGTGHAALQALPALCPDADRVLILYGDTPLLNPADLGALDSALRDHPHAPLALLTCSIDDPRGYGRIMRGADGSVVEIREHRDLRSDAERATREVNPGVYCARVAFLREALASLRPENAQGELYLTDIVAQAVTRGGIVDAPGHASSLVGINDRDQLALAERLMRERILARHRKSGVTLRAGAQVDDTVTLQADATIESHAVLRGDTTVGAGALVGVGCVLTDARIGNGAQLGPYCVVQGANVAPGAELGAFTRLGGGLS
ncbi:MAG: NTP transferase domain-containing protein [Polyangiaceae bacterium]|nr:NTP transferase domain-containing protein [Polyangiaceae bacterium]